MVKNYMFAMWLDRFRISSKSMIQLGLSIAFLSLSISVLAQSSTVSGRIIDETDGLGIPGVNIQEKGTSNGTITDIDGNYSLEVGTNAFLVISSVGFATQEISVEGRKSIDVSMAIDLTELGEVVVIGYGTTRKKDLTGSVTAITAKDFNQGFITSPQDLLTGRIAGVSVISDGGAPGAGSTIRIRGGSSLSASNNPLFVIDGVVISDERVVGTRNPLSLINPNDIEAITVLKDASATAIYGARASNGVVLVTTKRGKAGQAMSLSYNTQYSVSSIPNTIDVFSADGYRDLIGQATTDGNVPSAATALLGTENTDWQDEIYREAFGSNHNVSLTGSMKNTPSFMSSLPYRVSVGYTDQRGVLKKTRFQRFSGSLGLDPTFMDGDLEVQLNAKYSSSDNTFTNEGAIGSAVTFDPTQPVNLSDSPWGGYFYWEDTGSPGVPIGIAPSNPVALLKLTDNMSTVNRLLGNIKATYKVPFLSGLSATVNGAIDRTTTDGREVVGNGASWERRVIDSNVVLGRDNKYDGKYKNDQVELYLNYTKDISTDHKLTLLGGYSWQHFFRKTSSKTFDGTGTIVISPEDTVKSENFLISFYGRANYTLMDKYLFTFTLRRDGSSRFIDDNQWGLFPSAAFAWRAKDEGFLKNVEFLSDLKIRASYGITGQENVGRSNPALARVTTSDALSQYAFGQIITNVARFEGFDADLRWEKTTTYDVGLDFGFWDNRITGSFDWYERETTDLLNEIDIPSGSNFTNRILTNVGSMKIEGIELGLNAILVDQGDLKIDVGYNITKIDNTVTKLLTVQDPSYLGVETGGISGGVGSNVQIHSVGSPRNSFFVLKQVYDASGNPVEDLYEDQNGDGIINENDRVRLENPDPDVYMGFSSNVQYKQFNFGFNARLNLGNYNYRNVHSTNGVFDNAYNSAGYTNNLHTSVNSSGFVNPQFFSDYYLQDASFFRMDNITVGYRFDELFSNRVAGTLNFTVQNAFVITDYDGLDPEVSNGIDNNIYPRPRVFVVGLNINFK